MKKARFLSLTLVLVMILSLFSGCGGNSNGSSAEQSASSGAAPAQSSGEAQGPAQLVRLSMATGGTTGAMYIIGGGMSNIINQNTNNIDIVAEVTAGTVENLELVGKGECELGLSNSDFAQWAYEGEDPFSEPKNIRAIASVYPSTFHIVVGANSGIESVGDMAGKRIAVGPLGGGNRVNSEKLLAYYGISFSDIRPYDFNNQEMIDALKDGSIDGFILITGSPLAALIDLMMNSNVRFIDLEENTIADLTAQFSFFERLVLPADMYGTDEPVITMGVMNSLVVGADVDEDVVYYITKAIFENLQQVKDVHVLMAELNVQDAVNASIPLHPGAERYYKECGAL